MGEGGVSWKREGVNRELDEIEGGAGMRMNWLACPTRVT